MSKANNNSVLEFLDLGLHINEHNKICVDVYAKPTNSFIYVLPSTRYPKRSINKVPKGIALRLRRTCNSDEQFDTRSSECQNYLTLVKKRYYIVILPILYSDPEMKNIFPEGSINFTYKRGKSLRELISASMFPQAQVESHSMVSKCKSKRCDICQNYLVYKNEFTCTVTGKIYKVIGKLCCVSSNVNYLISCKLCK